MNVFRRMACQLSNWPFYRVKVSLMTCLHIKISVLYLFENQPNLLKHLLTLKDSTFAKFFFFFLLDTSHLASQSSAQSVGVPSLPENDLITLT